MIVGWNDGKISNVHDLVEALRGHDPNDVIRLNVRREGRQIETEVKLGEGVAMRDENLAFSS